MSMDVLAEIREAEHAAEERINSVRRQAEERKTTAEREAAALIEAAVAAAHREADALRRDSDQAAAAEAEALRASGRRRTELLDHQLSLIIAEGATLVLEYLLPGMEKPGT